ncbi:MAG: response regulator [Chloroflexi bacterium]|nr:MAG: response regulator [Chloroflexota bacterium]
MGLLAIRILIISHNLDFAVQVRRALEQLGGYEVASFTAATPALEYIQEHPQDLVLVDFNVPDMQGVDIVLKLRSIQPDIAILAAPDIDPVIAIAEDLGLQGVVDIPIPIRQLLPIIQDAVQQVHDALPDTQQAAPLQGDTSQLEIAPSTPPRQNRTDVYLPELIDSLPETIEIVLHDATGDEVTPTVTPQPPVEERSDKKAFEVFERLAAEEPPVPSFEESGTVRDLRLGVNDERVQEVLSHIDPAALDDNMPRVAAEDDEDEESPARVVLETTFDESTSAYSLQDLIASIERQLPPNLLGIRPLPSWEKEHEQLVGEPDFLPEDLPESPYGPYTAETTARSAAISIEEASDELDTDQFTPAQPEAPVEESDEVGGEEAETMTTPRPLFTEGDLETLQVPMSSAPVREPDVTADDIDIPVQAEAIEDTPAYTLLEHDDPEIAELALRLTQASLELTSEAIILARDGRLVAFTGTLPESDIEQLRQAVDDDWDALPSQSRIRFTTLPHSGVDFMLYTRRTDEGFTLTLVFSGNLPLHVIRRQCNRLVAALHSVPERELQPVVPAPQEAAPEIEPDASDEIELAEAEEESALLDVGSLTLYNFVLLVRDDDTRIIPQAAQLLSQRLAKVLNSLAWQLHTLQVEEDFIYLTAGVPDDVLPPDVVRELMTQTATLLAQAQPINNLDEFWADTYLVVVPGRELAPDEIQHFIHYARHG